MNSSLALSVLNFWFNELTSEQWWKADPSLDHAIKEKFSALHKQAANAELWTWRNTAEGSLAEIILLDQVSRNIYRNHAQAYAYDNMALVLAQEAISRKMTYSLSSNQLTFLYMPFMHSESKKMHTIALKLFSEPGLESNLQYEILHKKIIDQFGRYPHRNEILGRTSTKEELLFLQQPNSKF